MISGPLWPIVFWCLLCNDVVFWLMVLENFLKNLYPTRFGATKTCVKRCEWFHNTYTIEWARGTAVGGAGRRVRSDSRVLVRIWANQVFYLRSTKTSIPSESANWYKPSPGRIKHWLFHRLFTTSHCMGEISCVHNIPWKFNAWCIPQRHWLIAVLYYLLLFKWISSDVFATLNRCAVVCTSILERNGSYSSNILPE